MAADIRIVEEARQPMGMHPRKFALWLFMATVVMMFGAWTSAYIVKRGAPGWSSFELPTQFWINSLLIVISSITLALGQRSARRDELEKAKLMVSLTAVLGVLFLVGQYLAWGKMVEMNYYFTGTGSNTSGTFIYVLTGVHGVHVVSGVIVLLVLLFDTFRYKVHSKNMTGMEMCSMYWHFLGGLWLYLFVFLILNR